MAAGTVIEPLTTQTAEEISTKEFARVVETHRSQIFRFLLSSTRDVDLAETLTQECFLKAHRNWSHFRGDSTAMTWLMRIAINLQKDHWRNRRMQFWRQTRTNAIDVDEASEWLPSGERTAEQKMLAREQVGHVWKAVENLSERQRTWTKTPSTAAATSWATITPTPWPRPATWPSTCASWARQMMPHEAMTACTRDPIAELRTASALREPQLNSNSPAAA